MTGPPERVAFRLATALNAVTRARKALPPGVSAEPGTPPHSAAWHVEQAERHLRRAFESYHPKEEHHES